MAKILIPFEFIMDNLDNKEYLSRLGDLLTIYAKGENLIINLFHFETTEEQEIVLGNFDKSRNKVSGFLSQQNSIGLRKDSVALSV